MEQRTKRSGEGDNQTANRPLNDGISGEGLKTFRSEGESLLEACDRAISRALSGDSRDFLRRSRQEGGQ